MSIEDHIREWIKTDRDERDILMQGCFNCEQAAYEEAVDRIGRLTARITRSELRLAAMFVPPKLTMDVESDLPTFLVPPKVGQDFPCPPEPLR